MFHLYACRLVRALTLTRHTLKNTLISLRISPLRIALNLEQISNLHERPVQLFSRHPLAILGALFVIAYASVFLMFSREGHPKTILTGIDDKALHIDVNLLNVDLGKR